MDARGPAPVLAGRLVVVHARDGVHAFDRSSGTPVWSAHLPRTAQPIQLATTLAAAMGSGTLVVVSDKTVHLLRLEDGAEVWSGMPLARVRRLESPTVVGKSLYLVADGKALRLDGAPEPRGSNGAPVANSVELR
jgi:outer membrane protein assembly factor BamB